MNRDNIYAPFTGNNKSKVLITGATGFIGNYVVQELLNKGFEVIATSSNIEKAKSFPWFSSVTYIEFNIKKISDSINYFDFFRKPDIVIHLAWEGLPNYKNDFHLIENLPRHFSFIENLLKNGLQDITITGTCFEYGMQEGCLTEETPAMPGNPYAIAKNELRKKVESLKDKYSFSFKWARLFYMWGKGQNPKSLIAQLETALQNGDAIFNMSGGEQVRDFSPVEDVAANIVSVAIQKKVEGIINICSGKPVTVKTFVENYLQQRNIKIQLNLGFYPYPDFEPMKFWGSNEKFKKITRV